MSAMKLHARWDVMRTSYKKPNVSTSANGIGVAVLLSVASHERGHFMKPTILGTMPVLALFLMASDVSVPAPLIVAKSGQHCKDDPNCFNRIHYAIKPVARVAPGQPFVLETRDGLDSDFDLNSTAADVAAVNLNLCHPLTGPVSIEGAKRGDAIAVTVVDIEPDDFGTTTIVPGFGFLRDLFPDPYIVRWELNRLDARSKDMPGIAVPMNAFMGTVNCSQASQSSTRG